jgi:NADH:ubiquinone oxidoreductase subunit C
MSQEVLTHLQENFDFLELEDAEKIWCKPENLLDLFKYLKEKFPSLRIMDITCVHFIKENYFMVIYYLQEVLLEENKISRLFIKVMLREGKLEIDSISEIYPNAAWYEREIYEMFGIKFVNHPNLEYLLLCDDVVKYPLRKDVNL